MINLKKINTVNWENTNIAILGSGASGISAAKLAMHLKAKVLLSDVKKSNLDIDESSRFIYEYSGHSNKVLKSDLIIKSPGIPNQIDIIKKSKQKNIPIVSEIEFASWFSNSDIIAVTGSNGKTTTVNLLRLPSLVCFHIKFQVQVSEYWRCNALEVGRKNYPKNGTLFFGPPDFLSTHI